MRYFIVTYFLKKTGQYDEYTAISKDIKKNDLGTASIILDFQEKKILKCRAPQGITVEHPTWDNIAGYYSRHYTDIFNQLYLANGTQP